MNTHNHHQNTSANPTDLLDMKAAVVSGKGADFEIRSLKIRQPKGDEVLVKIVATGICHTDVSARNQYYPVPLPVVLGHEGAGIVQAVGSEVKDLKVGDHVILTYGYCGHCEECYTGKQPFCVESYERNFGGCDTDGSHAIFDEQNNPINDHFFSQSSFATLAIARESNAIKVPDNAPIELLGPLGCGIQTGAGTVMNALEVTPASSFAVWGAGSVGLSGLLGAKLLGASTIIAVDIVDSRLELAKELGATHVINSKKQDPVEAIREITGGGVKFALETTGIPAILTQGVNALGRLGKIAVVGAPPMGTPAEFDVNDLLIYGKSIIGNVQARTTPKKFIADLVDLYLKGDFPFDKLVKYYDFKDINQAVADSHSGVTLKPILKIADAAL
ncbi:NAD(P)-dependent alcohol dehydrogenase [Neisseria zalophi]|uniref:NAD(P)-dependent alcohol dehydrogenase n=1 Tax=Neisseria zalophi TaxID=640030 RepID=A0A5J6PST8_9NEIS|nr:NAD(P)-dependent alcohol dehydrogenase [Neisseria zalophi]QEY25426.1 NAD(P)-dependent alcohol dehydrogenase [Neisseria zalophi]